MKISIGAFDKVDVRLLSSKTFSSSYVLQMFTESAEIREKSLRKLFLIEWRPYVPQHIGITQYEERLFRLGAYSQYNVWNENADLIHEFIFFGGNWPKHDDLDLMAQEINDPEFNELVKVSHF